jgi:hypothetical protein
MEKERISHQGPIAYICVHQPAQYFQNKITNAGSKKASGLDTLRPGLGMKLTARGDNDITNKNAGSKYLHHSAGDDPQTVLN